MNNRRRLSPKLRFEIFKRDKFTCRYCGRTSPEVILEIDHIIPVSEGGTDDPENLVTSCYECNRGKGATLLEEIPLGEDEDIHERTILLAERELQLREYNEMLRKIRERKEREAIDLVDYWCQLWGLDPDKARHFQVPDVLSLQRFLDTIAAEDIRRAMLTAVTAQSVRTPNQGCKYLFAILHRWQREGRRD